jgi:hypothetical protein
VPEVGGMKYIAFLGTGMVCQSAMFTSSFEAMYSAFSRMHVQRTWEAIINAPDLARRRDVRRMDLGRVEGRDVDRRHSRRDHGAGLRSLVVRAMDHPAGVSWSALPSARSGS